jgi:putative transposase
VADITYIPTHQGWLFLAAVTDCYSRRIVGWSMRDTLEAELVGRTLREAGIIPSMDSNDGVVR